MSACTEKEAKDRWCPQVQVAMVTVGPVATTFQGNRGSISIHNINPPLSPEHAAEANTMFREAFKCMGSRCMWWRWRDPKAKAPDRRHGYCGAAHHEGTGYDD